MDPTSIGLIVLGVLIGVIGIFVSGLAVARADIAAPAVGLPPAVASFGAFFYILYYFLPYALFLFGFVADGITRQLQYAPAGIMGLIMVYVNYTIARFTGGNTVDTDFCGIPGLSRLGSDVMPQSILFVSTIMSYIAAYVTTINPTPGSSANWPAWTAVFALFLIQWGILWKSNCSGFIYGLPLAAFGALALGLAVGGGAGAGFASLAVTGKVDAPTTTGGGLGGIGPTAPKTPGVGTCSPPNDQDQFVCEAYKNGELITTTIAE
jgi:hypothetical protein